MEEIEPIGEHAPGGSKSQQLPATSVPSTRSLACSLPAAICVTHFPHASSTVHASTPPSPAPDRGVHTPCCRVGAITGPPPDTLEGLRVAGEHDPALREIAEMLSVQEAALGLCPGEADEPLGEWLVRVVGLLRATDSSEGGSWADVESFLFSCSSALGVGGVRRDDVDELLEMADLAHLTDICGQGNRAARHARDLIGLIFEKSIASAFFSSGCANDSHTF